MLPPATNLDLIPRCSTDSLSVGGNMKRILTALMSLALVFVPVPGHSQPQSSAHTSAIHLNTQAGICPNWAVRSNNAGFNGVKWSRSGSRKIFIEWTLTPTNLDGMPVSRRFSPDEADQIRAAFSWWDSVFDTVDFREVSGDYAAIKVGAMPNTVFASANYWFFQRSMTFARGQIAISAASNERVYSDGVSYNESQVRGALGYLLGLNANTKPIASVQSKLRQLYGENSCYPVELGASWDTSNGLPAQNAMAAIGSAQRVKLNYSGLSQVAATVLTPNVCRASNFSVTAQSGLLVNITGQGVCSVLVQAREGSLPFSSEVLTLRTGFAQKIIASGVPKTLMVGKSFTLTAVTNSGLPVRFASNTPSNCRVVGTKVIGVKSGACRIAAWANAADFGQLRFLYEGQILSLSVRK